MSSSYVDTSALEEWKVEMDKINQACIDEIDNISNAMNSFPDSLQGDYADKFEENFEVYAKNVKASHEALRNVESFLDEVVQVVTNH